MRVNYKTIYTFFIVSAVILVCYTAVFSVVTQHSSRGEESCVTTLKTAV